MVLYCGRQIDWNSAGGSDIQDSTTSDETRYFPTEFNAACTMAIRKRNAARAARSAVTGPFTTEYGPCMAGKRKIIRTQKTPITASSDPMRPEIIEVSQLLYRRAHDIWSFVERTGEFHRLFHFDFVILHSQPSE